jgi:hypothetical protein
VIVSITFAWIGLKHFVVCSQNQTCDDQRPWSYVPRLAVGNVGSESRDSIKLEASLPEIR